MIRTCQSDGLLLQVPAKNSYRMVVLGASKVGKSCIVSRFLSGRFEEQYTPTIEDFHRKVYNIHGEVYQLDILDTSGNHPFPAIRRLSILTGDIFVLVFELDSRTSFEEVERLHRQILECKTCLRTRAGAGAGAGLGVPIMLVGNKADRGEPLRAVRGEEAEQLIAGDQNSSYFEISAKRNTNLEGMFRALLSMSQLPHEMSPALHRKVSVQYSEAFHRKCSRSRSRSRGDKDKVALGMVSPFARRPSVNTDLMYLKAKVLGGEQDRHREKCSLQ
eukprot:gi/632989521/ref/XP_007883693.1/ PREDICTED: GTP-binding protein Rhes-like isoform X2 [Callorhinchus milii]